MNLIKKSPLRNLNMCLVFVHYMTYSRGVSIFVNEGIKFVPIRNAKYFLKVTYKLKFQVRERTGNRTLSNW